MCLTVDPMGPLTRYRRLDVGLLSPTTDDNQPDPCPSLLLRRWNRRRFVRLIRAKWGHGGLFGSQQAHPRHRQSAFRRQGPRVLLLDGDRR